MEAAWPMHTVATSGRMYCMVSYIARPEDTTPPGELMYIKMSLVGFSASRNSNCAHTRVDTMSLIGPVMKIMRSFNNRE